jgi:predicted ATPase
MQTIRENLRAAVAEEATLLVSVVPALSVLFEDRLGEEAKSKPGCAAPFTTRSNRLHYVMRQLFKVICNADHPTVLVLDDMQWCDSSTLELLESIVTDLSLSHLLIVATCREEAQGAARSFLDLLATLRDTHRLSVRSIHLGNLDQSAVLSMVSTALRSSEERTVKLSEIVHQKSHGNPLYALQFLTRLYDDGLLKYSLGMMQWQWCDLRVRTRFVMDNVADLTSAKLQNLSLQKRTVLQIASCIGHTFGKEHLEFVIRGPRVRQLFVPEDDTWPADLDLCLTGLIEEAAIDFVPELKCYCFVHDTIHDAAFRLIPDVDRIKVQSEVGRRLLRSAEHVHCPRFSDMYFFRAVELSNSGALLLAEDEALELAKHNLEAGLRAISKAAFTSALKYMEEGLQLLGPSGWEKQPELVLNLVEGAAEASYCCGDFVAMEKHLESVLTRELPICDKVRCYLTRILSHGAQDRNSLALETGRKVLVEMKVSTLPMKPGIFHVFVELMKTKRCLKKYDQQSLLSLPNLENKKWYQAMSVVDMMNAIAYCSDINFFAVMNLRMMRWTLSHGVCQFSPTVFCTYGIILCGLGELKEAHKFGASHLR